ncbi:hypothetical protein KBI5_23315 [Frankia sp. KB5]|nr:hypothetical protein KBI5_23315 [Frankia sp. KB5]
MEAVGEARRHAAWVVRDWDLPEVVEVVELVVSELMTNAVKNSGHDSKSDDPHAVTALRVTANGMNLLLEVWDESSASPVLQEQHLEAESGRGLLLVAALVKRWSYYFPKTGGKVVWAELDLPAPQPVADPTDMTHSLPRRESAVQWNTWPIEALPVTFTDDPAVLQRVADRLRALDDWVSAAERHR